MSYQVNICYGIKRLRKAKNLTQQEFAEKINISIPAIRKLEKAINTPSSETIDKICKEFNISPVELLLPDLNNNLTDIKTHIYTKLETYELEKLVKIAQIIDII